MKRLSLILSALLVIGFAATGITYIRNENHKVELREVKLKDTSADLKELQLKYDVLNQNLDTELHKNTTDEQKVKQLEEEKQQLEQQKQDLERQLQARLEAKRLAQQKIDDAARSATATATASAATPSGGKYDWMASAGISPSDYQAVDYIVSKESGWRHTVWNGGGSGAYGLCQALPASKMASAGADWQTNPVTQLKWCHGYAQARYGGWWGAYNFWVSNHWW